MLEWCPIEERHNSFLQLLLVFGRCYLLRWLERCRLLAVGPRQTHPQEPTQKSLTLREKAMFPLYRTVYRTISFLQPFLTFKCFRLSAHSRTSEARNFMKIIRWIDLHRWSWQQAQCCFNDRIAVAEQPTSNIFSTRVTPFTFNAWVSRGLMGHNIHLFLVTSSVTALCVKLSQRTYVVGIVASSCAHSNLLDQCNNRHQIRLYQSKPGDCYNPASPGNVHFNY